jgi:hypothetical protein
MFRARLASVVLAATLVSTSGCCVFDHPWFRGPGCRDGCCPPPGCAAPCDSCLTSGSPPISEGPFLPGGAPPELGQVPGNGPPRLVPTPHSAPMPYTP